MVVQSELFLHSCYCCHPRSIKFLNSAWHVLVLAYKGESAEAGERGCEGYAKAVAELIAAREKLLNVSEESADIYNLH